MNNINNITFHTKLRELIPSLPNSITPEVLNKISEDECVQPFLKWFYSNISQDNVLPDECIKLKKHIQDNDVWLKGRELDLALEEATKDCPELLKLIESDYWNSNQSFIDLTTEKELYDSDLEHFQLVEGSLQKLKQCEDKIVYNIDNEIDALEKEEVNVKLIYEKCTTVLEDFDLCHRQFFKAVELLATTYSNAVEKKGEACTWTHMPIELYIKQLETYNDYLNSYAKRQFSMSSEGGNETNINNHASILNDSNENEKINEIMCCQKNLFTSKLHEIITKVEDDASKSLLNYVTEIYNNGNLKTPSTPVLARAEIAELTKRRDFLEENVYFLRERQLVDIVQHFSNIKVIKVLEEEAETRLERRKDRLLRLERLYMLAKEHGHAFSTLLCMLFELQIHRINEIIQFVIDARHYLSMVYSLSSLRNESMQKLQKEYSSISVSAKDQNAFCKTFIGMAALDDLDIQASINYYDELKNDNAEKLKILFEEKLTETIESSKELESAVVNLYNSEITSGPTNSFKAVPCNVQNEIDKTVTQIEKLEANVEAIKNKLKNMIKETSTPNYEREKLLIWQKFLADPELLKSRCQKLEELRDQEAFQLN